MTPIYTIVVRFILFPARFVEYVEILTLHQKSDNCRTKDVAGMTILEELQFKSSYKLIMVAENIVVYMASDNQQ